MKKTTVTGTLTVSFPTKDFEKNFKRKLTEEEEKYAQRYFSKHLNIEFRKLEKTIEKRYEQAISFGSDFFVDVDLDL